MSRLLTVNPDPEDLAAGASSTKALSTDGSGNLQWKTLGSTGVASAANQQWATNGSNTQAWYDRTVTVLKSSDES